MKIGIEVKIDVTKLDKARFYAGKNGAQYASLTMFVDSENVDQYGNHGFITQATTKEERDAGVKLPILGNNKIFWGGDTPKLPANQAPPQQAPQPTPQSPPDAFSDNDSIPF